MLDTEAPTTEHDTPPAGTSSQAARYTGERTPPETRALVAKLTRKGKSPREIAAFLGMSPYTVQAVIELNQDAILDSQERLTAHALEITQCLVDSAPEAAKRGKTSDLLALTHALGITQPPKTGANTQIGIAIQLNGGPAPGELSLAKRGGESAVEGEAREIQAQSSEGLIMGLTSPVANPPQAQSAQALSATEPMPTLAQVSAPGNAQSHTATNVAESEK